MLKYLQGECKHYLYLSVFRVFIAIDLIYKIITWAHFSGILFGNESFIVRYNDPLFAAFGFNAMTISQHYKILLVLMLLFAILSMFGVFKNFSLWALLFFLEIVQRLNPLILNGGDNLLKFLLLYLSFADSFRFFTLFRSKNKTTDESIKNMLSNISVISIKMHLCLVYAVSGLHKVNSKVWFSGVGLYYCMALERFRGTSINKYLIQNGVFVTASTYSVMLWEVFFPFLVFIKKTRTPALCFGMIMHIGIFVFMMIYDFELIFIMCYGFFYSDEELILFWDKLSRGSMKGWVIKADL